jgi:hypothetical protein
MRSSLAHEAGPHVVLMTRKPREKEPRTARNKAHMSASIVSSQIEWLTRWTRRNPMARKKGDVAREIMKKWN